MRSQRKPTFEEDLLTIKKQVEKKQKERVRMARSSTRQRKALTASVPAAVVAIVFLAVFGFQAAGREDVVQVLDLLRPTDLWRVQFKQWQTAQVRDVISNGDVVRTGRTGEAHLGFPDGSLVKVGPGTSLVLRYNGFDRPSGARYRRIDLAGGRIWAHVARFASADSTFTVNTPAALAGVKGTRFSVVVYAHTGDARLPDGATYFSVLDGDVSVAVPGTTAITVLHAGEEALAIPNMTTSPVPSRMNAAEVAEWRRQSNDPTEVTADIDHTLLRQLTQFSEQFVVRPIAIVASGLHITSISGEASNDTAEAAYDGRAYVHAIAAASALQKALEVANDPTDGYPTHVGLADLAGLNLKPEGASRILKSVDANRLISYQKMTNSYVLYLRAHPPLGTLFEVTPESIREVNDVRIR